MAQKGIQQLLDAENQAAGIVANARKGTSFLLQRMTNQFELN